MCNQKYVLSQIYSWFVAKRSLIKDVIRPKSYRRGTIKIPLRIKVISVMQRMVKWCVEYVIIRKLRLFLLLFLELFFLFATNK